MDFQKAPRQERCDSRRQKPTSGPTKQCSEQETEETPLINLMGITILDLYVGPHKKHFRVHKDLICARIDHFDILFNSPIPPPSQPSAAENIGHFPTADPISFGLLIEWLYTLQISPILPSPAYNTQTPTAQPLPSGLRGQLSERIRLYVLAAQYGIPPLQNRAIDQIVTGYRALRKRPAPEDVAYVYAHTFAKSPLRKFMARYIAFLVRRRGEDNAGDRAAVELVVELAARNGELLRDVLKVLGIGVDEEGNGNDDDDTGGGGENRYGNDNGNRNGNANPTLLPPCTFHVHRAESAARSLDDRTPDRRQALPRIPGGTLRAGGYGFENGAVARGQKRRRG